ncbi:hypothetical protein Tco_0924362 [Tanacetum coccineum]|uniref:Uncharacterized protein n=1 Tax=Tanacetum coccineum TaxID=301880 RepID=A0ABQ5D6N1_9ASTR
MSNQANHVSLTPGGYVVRNTAGKGSGLMPDIPLGFVPAEMIREFCDKHYDQLLSLMAEKREIEKEWDAADRANRRAPAPILTREAPILESENSGGGHLKSKSKKQKTSTDEDKRRTPSPLKSAILYSQREYECRAMSKHMTERGIRRTT